MQGGRNLPEVAACLGSFLNVSFSREQTEPTDTYHAGFLGCALTLYDTIELKEFGDPLSSGYDYILSVKESSYLKFYENHRQWLQEITKTMAFYLASYCSMNCCVLDNFMDIIAKFDRN